MEDDIKVEFFTNIKGLADIEECKPKPTKNFIPSWWKNVPSYREVNPSDSVVPEIKNVKMCPSFVDYFSLGYVIPMWADTTLKFSEKEDSWSWNCGNPGSPFYIEFHGQDQFINHAPAKLQGNSASFVFKFISPWYIRTPKGYSCLQLPMFFHFNDNFSVIPGKIDTDIYHIINQQVMYHGSDKEVFIPRGTPLVQYIPIKRELSKLEVKYFDESFSEDLDKINIELYSKFSGAYKSMQRKPL